jgi:SAM-dependent methyltransferase
MRAQARVRDARLPGRVGDAALPDIGQPFGGGFDGVVCGAVLMHVPPAALPPSLASLAALLRPGGRLLIALPEMRADLLVDGADPDGRAFANHAPERVQHLLAERGLALLSATEMDTVPTDTRWHVLRFASGD